MIPKIGLKVNDILYKGEDKILFKTLEITSRDKSFFFNKMRIDHLLENIKGIDLSMHSQLKRTFSSSNKEFNQMEVNILKAEIIACKYLHVKELIVHFRDKKLENNQIKLVKELINFAKKNKVELIYESNGKFKAEVCFDFFRHFPSVRYNLDLGHFNTAVCNKTLGMNYLEFIKKIRDKIIYIHAHNNGGEEDEHISLDKGSLDWKEILDLINLKKVRKIIIEARGIDNIKETQNSLENYLKRGMENESSSF